MRGSGITNIAITMHLLWDYFETKKYRKLAFSVPWGMS